VPHFILELKLKASDSLQFTVDSGGFYTEGLISPVGTVKIKTITSKVKTLLID